MVDLDILGKHSSVGVQSDHGPDFARFLDASGRGLPWFVPLFRVLLLPGARSKYIVKRCGKEWMSFTDVGEALSQARSMEYYAGWKRVTVVSVT